MSADNILIILQKKNRWRAYDVSASDDDYKRDLKKSQIKFEAYSLEEAIKKAQYYCDENFVEYNFRIEFEEEE
jgi:hypothetical protein